jgi:hypothetical protein
MGLAWLGLPWGVDRDDKLMSATDARHAYGSMQIMQSGSHVEIDSFIRSTIQVIKKSDTEVFKLSIQRYGSQDWSPDFLSLESVG